VLSGIKFFHILTNARECGLEVRAKPNNFNLSTFDSSATLDAAGSDGTTAGD
jgi:hypothetical protein